jgi:hypothetical protein
MQTIADHWNHVYETKDPTKVSWYQPVPATSLRLFATHARSDDPVIDVGAGASLLVDHLIERGHRDITLLDVSAVALEMVKRRLGEAGEPVQTVVTDILEWTPPRRFGVWHDRAVFHFLTDPAQIATYRALIQAGAAPGGVAIVAAFHLTGPSRCSGLPTSQYDAASLHAALGGDEHFELIEAFVELHPHPNGSEQAFQVVVLRRRDTP